MTPKSFPSIQMEASPKQQLELTQRLMMSAQMKQALRLLQLPLVELELFIEEQMTLNPLLELEDSEEKEEFSNQEEEAQEEQPLSKDEIALLSHLEEQGCFTDFNTPLRKFSSEEDKLHTYLEQSLPFQPSLQDHLYQQAHDSFETQRELQIAKILIGYIDRWGFLKTPLSEINALHQFEEKETQQVLKAIQSFEPYGIGAATIQESLLIQLRCLCKDQTLAYRRVNDHYDQLLRNHLPLIQKQLKCSYAEMDLAIQEIAKLDLHPGTQHAQAFNFAIIPDVTLREENDHLVVEVDREYAPSLRLNRRYLKLLEDPSLSKEHKQFIKNHLVSARWLMRNLQQRYSTLERIAQSLAEKQYPFFTEPDGKLVPLTMKKLAEELQVHESTIARTVSNKYLYSPRGLFPLRAFFTNKYLSEEGKDISSTTVREAILALIQKEDKKHPLSDQKISSLLKEQGMTCARRTVAKYRFLLQVGNAQQRRKFI
jgi:RNA polymerase sigma-54 factor